MGMLKPEKNEGLRAKAPAPYLDKRVTKWLFRKKKPNHNAKKILKESKKLGKWLDDVMEYG